MPINERALRKQDVSPAFYCVHDITGGALSEFAQLASHLDRTTRFFGIQAPASLMPDPDFAGSIKAIAAHYAEVLQEFQPEGPLFLGGFCAGAIIALEIAQRLQASRRNIALLVAIDAVPENTCAELRPWHPHYVLSLMRNVPGWFKHGGLIREKDSHSLPRRCWNNVIAIGKAVLGRQHNQSLHGGYSIAGLMNLARYSPVQRQFINRLYSACFDYAPKPYSGNVVVYEANVKPLFHLPQLASRWHGFAPQAEVVAITGTHLSMMRDPYVDQMARDLQQRIAVLTSEQPRRAN